MKVIFNIFAPTLAIFEILTFEIFYLENLDQGHRVQLSQWRRSMANIKFIKAVTHIFVLALTISDILTFVIFNFETGQGHRV